MSKSHKHSKVVLLCNAGVLEEIEQQLQGRDVKGFLESLFLEVDGWMVSSVYVKCQILSDHYLVTFHPHSQKRKVRFSQSENHFSRVTFHPHSQERMFISSTDVYTQKDSENLSIHSVKAQKKSS